MSNQLWSNDTHQYPLDQSALPANVVTTTGTQTITNKTINGPVINLSPGVISGGQIVSSQLTTPIILGNMQMTNTPVLSFDSTADIKMLTQTNLEIQPATNQDSGKRITQQAFSGSTNGLANIIQTFTISQTGAFSIEITINCLCTGGVHIGASGSFRYLYRGIFLGGSIVMNSTPLINIAAFDAALTGIAVTYFVLGSNQIQIQSVGTASDVIQWNGVIQIYS